jgi:hypothetical protein
VGLRRWLPRRGLEQLTVLTNVRRIDPVSFVATQLGAREVSNLGGIGDADNMTGLVQRICDAETVAPSGFQTGVDTLDVLRNQPIQEKAERVNDFETARNVSMTLRQPGVEFKLGCLGSSAGPHSSVKYNKATCTTWQSLAEENVGLKGARCARIASGD